jgi:hypothetical protein
MRQCRVAVEQKAGLTVYISCRGVRQSDRCRGVKGARRRRHGPTAASLFQLGYATPSRQSAESLDSSVGFRVRGHSVSIG